MFKRLVVLVQGKIQDKLEEFRLLGLSEEEYQAKKKAQDLYLCRLEWRLRVVERLISSYKGELAGIEASLQKLKKQKAEFFQLEELIAEATKFRDRKK